jgi:hypothetical protein
VIESTLALTSCLEEGDKDDAHVRQDLVSLGPEGEQRGLEGLGRVYKVNVLPGRAA